MKRYVLSRLAIADLREISRYSAREWGRLKTDAYLRDIRQTIKRLAASPGIGISCEDIKVGHRRHGVGSHSIFYRLAADRIEIIRILHQSMDAGRHLP